MAPKKGGKKISKGGKKTKQVHIHLHGGATTMDGEGFFGDLWHGIKSGVNAIKNSHIISTVASLIPDARAQAVSGVAGKLGFGKRSQWAPVR